MTLPDDTSRAAARPALLADVLRRFGSVRVRAAGNSMRPAIRPGDVLLIADCGFGQVAPGDVVLFTRDARLFAHRVVDKRAGPDGPSIVTRGDANWQTDPAVGVGELLGKVIAVQRGTTTSSPPSGPSWLRRARGLIASECAGVVRQARAVLRSRAPGIEAPASERTSLRRRGAARRLSGRPYAHRGSLSPQRR